jgi:hypothetical protein
LVVVSCQRQPIEDVRGNKKPDGVNDIKFPTPEFDLSDSTIARVLRIKCRADGAVIEKPYWYTLEGDSDYWIRVELLNPDFGDKSFKEFGKEISLIVLEHLINTQDFEKIEVRAVSKTGVIVTFSKTQNAFFYIDSLRAGYN